MKASSIILILLLASCSAKWHLEKAIQKDPTILQDTTMVIDTVVIREAQVVTDTVLTTERDTVLIENERVRVRVVREFDTLMVEAECKADTVRISKEVKVPVYRPAPPDPWWKKVLVWVGGAALIALLFGIVWRKFLS